MIITSNVEMMKFLGLVSFSGMLKMKGVMRQIGYQLKQKPCQNHIMNRKLATFFFPNIWFLFFWNNEEPSILRKYSNWLSFGFHLNLLLGRLQLGLQSVMDNSV